MAACCPAVARASAVLVEGFTREFQTVTYGTLPAPDHSAARRGPLARGGERHRSAPWRSEPNGAEWKRHEADGGTHGGTAGHGLRILRDLPARRTGRRRRRVRRAGRDRPAGTEAIRLPGGERPG